MKNFKSIAAGLYMGIAAVGMSAGSAHATLLSVGDSTGAFTGGDVVTFDDATNLEWLDLTLSTNRSVNHVVRQFAAGGDFDGFRHATTAELFAVLASEGLTTLSDSTHPATGLQINAFITLFGDTGAGGVPFSAGLLSPSSTAPPLLPSPDLVSLTYDPDDLDPPLDHRTAVNRFGFSPTIGHWLVRQATTTPVTISAPAPLGILALALFGLAVSRRSRSNKYARRDH